MYIVRYWHCAICTTAEGLDAVILKGGTQFRIRYSCTDEEYKSILTAAGYVRPRFDCDSDSVSELPLHLGSLHGQATAINTAPKATDVAASAHL
jgi:hypothetical protein